ncbi:MAG: SPOR domain-containing protein [Spirochaetaceae bacterium]
MAAAAPQDDGASDSQPSAADALPAETPLPAPETPLPERLGIETTGRSVTVDEIVSRAETLLENDGGVDAALLAEQIGELLETANRFEDASSWYERAAADAEGDVRARIELARAGVLVQLGRTEAALSAARSGRDAAESRELRIRAIGVMAVAYAADQRYTEAQDILRGIEVAAPEGGLSPETLYQIYQLARTTGDDRAARDARETLASRHPDSPEARVVAGDESGRLFLALTPAAILQGVDRAAEPAQEEEGGPDDPDEAAPERTAGEVRYFVQVGSFGDSENAGYMRRDMESIGFEATVAKADLRGSTYYQVLIPVAVDADSDPQDAVQEVVVRLKERGYEGFLVTR